MLTNSILLHRILLLIFKTNCNFLQKTYSIFYSNKKPFIQQQVMKFSDFSFNIKINVNLLLLIEL